MIGVVKSYDVRRGMGFITPASGGVDISVHVSEVERAGFAQLADGDRLRFDIQTDRARRRSFAVNLERV